MNSLSSGQAAVATLGRAKLPCETNGTVHILKPDRQVYAECRLADCCFAHGISLLLAILKHSSQSQPSSCYFGVRATKEKNRRYFKEQMSLIILHLKHYLRSKVQCQNFPGHAKKHRSCRNPTSSLEHKSLPFSLEH